MPQQARAEHAPGTGMLYIGRPNCFNLFYILRVFLKMHYIFSVSIQLDKLTFQKMKLTTHK